MRDRTIRRLLLPVLLLTAAVAGRGASRGEAPTAREPALVRLLRAAATDDDHVLFRLRDGVLEQRPGGRRAIELFHLYQPQMAAAMAADPGIGDVALDWLDAWRAPLAALVEGRGGQTRLTQAQVDALLSYVERMQQAADPGLRAALAREAERMGVSGWAGMTMNDWLRRVDRLSCAPSPTVLCLGGGRFRVEASWRRRDGSRGIARAVPLTADTGYFWFFDAANVEALVKLVDGCGFNQAHWVFAAGLTNVEVDLSVADTWAGRMRRYRNPLDRPFRPLQDTAAFRTCAVAAPSHAPLAGNPGKPPALPAALAAPAHACVPGPEALCLQGGRFRVETEWRTADGTSGRGRAVPLTADTGTFWFFSPDNIEEVVKVHDGCGLNDRFWVFAAGLTDVRVTTRVTDTHSARTRVYTNPLGRAFAPVQDTGAFATCG